jgi:hypothetical protein
MSDQKHVEVGPKLNIKTGPDRIVKITLDPASGTDRLQLLRPSALRFLPAIKAQSQLAGPLPPPHLPFRRAD